MAQAYPLAPPPTPRHVCTKQQVEALSPRSLTTTPAPVASGIKGYQVTHQGPGLDSFDWFFDQVHFKSF